MTKDIIDIYVYYLYIVFDCEDNNYITITIILLTFFINRLIKMN